MITAGTVAAYLTLSTDDFSAGISEALGLLKALKLSGEEGGGAMELLRLSLEGAALSVKGLFAPAIGEAASKSSDSCMDMAAFIEASASLAASAFGSAAQSITLAAGSMSGGVSGAGTAVSAALEASSAAGSSSVAALSLAVGGASSEIAEKLSAAASGASGSGSAISSALSAASEVVGAAMGAAAESISSLASCEPKAKADSDGISKAIIAPFQPLGGTLYGLMQSAGAGMASGLQSKAASIIAVAQGIAARVVETIKSALEIASPSRVMKKLGEQTGLGLALGIAGQAPLVERQARLLSQAAAAGASTRISAAASVGLSDPAPRETARQSAAVDFSGLDSRLDRLIELISGAQQVMQIDGRAFGKLVREYA